MVLACARRRFAGNRLQRRFKDLLDPLCTGRAFGINHKQAGNHHHRIQDDGEVAQKRNDFPRLGNARVHAERAHNHHCRKAKV